MLSLLEGDVVTSVPPSISQSFPSELQDFFARYGSYCTLYALTPSILPSLFFHPSSFPSLFSHPIFPSSLFPYPLFPSLFPHPLFPPLLHHLPFLHYSLTPFFLFFIIPPPLFPSFRIPSPPSFFIISSPLFPSSLPHPLLLHYPLTPSSFPLLLPHLFFPSLLFPHCLFLSFIILSPPSSFHYFLTLSSLRHFLTPFVPSSPPSSFHFFHPLFPSSLPHPLLASFILLSPSTSFLPLFTHPTFLHYGGTFLTPSLPCWRKLPPSPSLLSSLLYFILCCHLHYISLFYM